MTWKTRPATSKRLSYGPHPDQWADLYLPAGLPGRGTVVVVHGGYWRDKYTAQLGVPMAEDLVQHGFAVWNLEYRRAGSGGAPGAGGWPVTFEDIAAGIDHLAAVADRFGLNPRRTVALGHSAGGHLAVWAAGRHTLPAGAPGARPKVLLAGVVSQAGLLDLAAAERLRLSDGAAVNLMGGTPDELGEAYTLADPARSLPIGTVVHAVHSREDTAVPFALSARYVEAARAAGDPAELHEVAGDHFAVIDPAQQAYRTCRELLERLLP
ncbi:alpha/beta hydrolase [Arthrobacter mobilis]|uniref:Alpha/beta hydrolase n=1 Tax=Arthrobacter mobilis TaxID=2724944 RepID=A0A7X6K789_9MICC|nr:alpha/beta hydrolase [Arthrobacter mobilis]NKX56414.1 alpha/beta hydrolase [Arthrobacter mobilis]